MRGWRLVLTGALLFWGISLGLGAECLQPVLTTVFPPQVLVGGADAVRMVKLSGTDLGFDPIWRNPAESSRCRSQLWVRRRSEVEEPWTVVESGDDAGPLTIGDGGNGWARLDLSGLDWLGEPASIELMVVKGLIRDDGSLRETGRTSIAEVTVAESVSYGLEIRSLTPQAVRPGSAGALIVMDGAFTWGTEVLIDGKPSPKAVVRPGDDRAEVWLPAEMLRKPGSRLVSLRDGSGGASEEVVLLVEAPTTIQKTSPSRLKQGRAGQTLKVRFDGAVPEEVTIRFEPETGTARVAANPQANDFSEGFSRGDQSQSETIPATPVVSGWRTVDFRVRKAELRIEVDSSMVPGPGVLIVRLTGRTGEVATVIPVEGDRAGPGLMPGGTGGIPERKDAAKERPRY